MSIDFTEFATSYGEITRQDAPLLNELDTGRRLTVDQLQVLFHLAEYDGVCADVVQRRCFAADVPTPVASRRRQRVRWQTSGRVEFRLILPAQLKWNWNETAKTFHGCFSPFVLVFNFKRATSEIKQLFYNCFIGLLVLFIWKLYSTIFIRSFAYIRHNENMHTKIKKTGKINER